ncbi:MULTISPECIES: cell wall anchor protein [Chryseobacterium]|jgi:hypothetical protein|uniref:Cell wall anchor protein n=1 Tax=Chryseobacterium geocarposphaerae TaxID=1416776 RepID=A0ABU1LF25_9FLAO|nr:MULTISPECIES: cell wall anchor protein [Chryseobacterium]MDR6405318.1 hypothetical protein [Chryseobacterium geocarposphaerae]MDR6697477.1 hypothetical protein [Chryseobacterium ginsenosidimutans]
MRTKLMSIAILASSFSFAQTWNLTGNTGINSTTDFLGTTDAKDLILKTGNIERMNINSVGKITLKQQSDLDLSFETFGRLQFNTDTTSDGMHIFNNKQMMAGADVVWISSAYQPNDTGLLSISSPPTAGDWSKPVFSVRSNGKVFMGVRLNFSPTCSDCSEYRLFVQDGIRTEKIKVDIASANNWADYVFKKDYKLRTLEEVEKHITEKGHLPNIPAADEIVKNGINLAEMDAKLLEKIEELTLYSIEQNKKIQNQTEKIEKLEKKLNQLLSEKK